jgi:hypothetical protein
MTGISDWSQAVKEAAVDQYVIRVDGRLADDAMADFPDLHVSHEPVQTVLQGELPDQAALAGVLDYLDEIGVVIIEVLKVPSDQS